jgi:hypothetical protein
MFFTLKFYLILLNKYLILVRRAKSKPTSTNNSRKLKADKKLVSLSKKVLTEMSKAGDTTGTEVSWITIYITLCLLQSLKFHSDSIDDNKMV